MKPLQFAFVFPLMIVLGTIAQAHDPKAPLNSEQRIFLTQYELARVALAADDLRAAKAATAVVAALTVIHHEASGDAPPGFVQDARKFMEATSLQQAREIFKSYSKRAVHVTEGKSGYYVVHCAVAPNDERDWVQATPTVSDPYAGLKTPMCGALRN
jgi:hypothetical protein